MGLLLFFLCILFLSYFLPLLALVLSCRPGPVYDFTNLLHREIIKRGQDYTISFKILQVKPVCACLSGHNLYFFFWPRCQPRYLTDRWSGVLDPRSSRGHRFHIAWGLFGFPPYFIFLGSGLKFVRPRDIPPLFNDRILTRSPDWSSAISKMAYSNPSLLSYQT